MTSHDQSTLGAILLCGGRSSRMGRPKHMLPFGERTVLEVVAETIGKVAGKIVVVAAAGQQLPDLGSACEIIRDEEEFQGPLAGLLMGMKFFDSETDRVFLSGCDVPMLREEFLSGIVAELGDFEMAIPEADGYLHPLSAVYHMSLRDRVEALYNQGERRPRRLVDGCRAKRISEERLKQFDPDLNSLKNMNSPDEYTQLLREAGFSNETQDNNR
ncbi:putative molybdenum cofactor guanylyltransferase [Thalassoglobus neptunius]|uniref:Probable molybdenum cofactor guanylyltransferase n=1 Tax=Thalassoglobus neptunius TaxID=1938619 RepID=A0A5C5X2A0_9PLAN|nr:molybdenum cofactor guanylyltransferase [Thalassoglobus neptunius]TWT56749.1 putative molybdenum cofactor guanylyltransferase [Thalassoglobus neptunius]